MCSVFRQAFFLLPKTRFSVVPSALSSPLRRRFSIMDPKRESERENIGSGYRRELGSKVPDPLAGGFGRLLLKPVLFAAVTCLGAFAISAVYTYEEARIESRTSRNPDPQRLFSMTHAKASYQHSKWGRIKDESKLILSWIIVNLMVYLLWFVFPTRTMRRLFTSNPFSKSTCLPMILSIFSHSSFFHLIATMFLFVYSLPSAVYNLGKETAIALYLSAGTIASLTSHAVKVARRHSFDTKGASGAALGLFAAVCVLYPNDDLVMYYLSGVSMPSIVVLALVIALDAACLLMGFKKFDHAAHLGGAIFGAAFAAFGQRAVLPYQRKVVEAWVYFWEDTV